MAPAPRFSPQASFKAIVIPFWSKEVCTPKALCVKKADFQVVEDGYACHLLLAILINVLITIFYPIGFAGQINPAPLIRILWEVLFYWFVIVLCKDKKIGSCWNENWRKIRSAIHTSSTWAPRACRPSPLCPSTTNHHHHHHHHRHISRRHSSHGASPPPPAPLLPDRMCLCALYLVVWTWYMLFAAINRSDAPPAPHPQHRHRPPPVRPPAAGARPRALCPTTDRLTPHVPTTTDSLKPRPHSVTEAASQHPTPSSVLCSLLQLLLDDVQRVVPDHRAPLHRRLSHPRAHGLRRLPLRPVALWHRGRDQSRADDTKRQSVKRPAAAADSNWRGRLPGNSAQPHCRVAVAIIRGLRRGLPCVGRCAVPLQERADLTSIALL